MRLFEIKETYKIFVDLDGVLADFERGVEKIVKEKHDEEKYETDTAYKKRMWKAIEKYSKDGGELWYELHLMSDAKDLWNYIKKHKPQILSATGYPEYKAAEQKIKWIKEKFGDDIKVNLVQAAADKQKYADKNHILIDDKSKAIDPWIKSGGIGILHTNAKNTIKELSKLNI